MDSLDAQCLIVELSETGGLTPDQWNHLPDGALACRLLNDVRKMEAIAA